MYSLQHSAQTLHVLDGWHSLPDGGVGGVGGVGGRGGGVGGVGGVGGAALGQNEGELARLPYIKQRPHLIQKLTALDHKNKIQSLLLPTYDPPDAPDCMCEYGACICKYGRMCHTATTTQKFGFSLQPELDLAFLVRPEPPKVCQLQNMANSAKPAKKATWWAQRRKKMSSNIFLRKPAIFQSLMRGIAKQHGFWYIIYAISTCI